MRIAVITPVFRAAEADLAACLGSVERQTLACDHFLVCDGDGSVVAADRPNLQVLRLPRPHQDVGNAARAIGSVSAICQGFDAIAYLDADNWFDEDHLERMCALQARTGAAVCSSGRRLRCGNGSLLGTCPEVDGERFVDTNCLFLTREAFRFAADWFLMPRDYAHVGDRYVWKRIRESGISRHHEPHPSINYRTRYESHYLYFGRQPPPDAKTALVSKKVGRDLTLPNWSGSSSMKPD